MKFLANENFMASGVRVLRTAGLDVTFIGEDSPSIKDWEVMEIAIATNRTILTQDRDYGELVFKYGYRPSAGVIYFRIKDLGSCSQRAENFPKVANFRKVRFDVQHFGNMSQDLFA